MRAIIQSVCLVGMLAAFPGCGSDHTPPRSAVTGTVTLDGKPLPSGMIRFVPLGETPGRKISVAIRNGQFSSEAKYGPCVGRHRIEIESGDTHGLAMDDEHAIARLRSQGIRYIQVLKIPPAYNTRSVLEEEVLAARPNEYSFDLKTKR